MKKYQISVPDSDPALDGQTSSETNVTSTPGSNANENNSFYSKPQQHRLHVSKALSQKPVIAMTMNTANNAQSQEAMLYKFSRHVPKLLQSQIMTSLVSDFLFEAPSKNHHGGSVKMASYSAEGPSIQRFHGALLFVDISGFTSLSLKLDVDSLKNHINNYFTKMLAIVEKWGGDVIKFAGDALFIVWPTDIHCKEQKNNERKEKATAAVKRNSIRSSMLRTGPTAGTTTDEMRFAAAAKSAVEKAVACGLEICNDCSHYEVLLNDTAPAKTGILEKMLPSWLLPSKVSPETQHAAYLDVHAGVSVGLMAAMDIGHKNRWEYFILGTPIKSAAIAEGKAAKGELVLCPRAHHILHRAEKDSLPTLYGNDQHSMETQPSEHLNQQKKCSCLKLDDHYYCILKTDFPVPLSEPSSPHKMMRSRSKSKLDLLATENEASSKTSKLKSELDTQLDQVLTLFRPLIKRRFIQILSNSIKGTHGNGSGNDANSSNSNSNSSSNGPVWSVEDGIKLEALLSDLLTGQLRDHFQSFIQQSLTNELAKHVHEVVRDNFRVRNNRSSAFATSRLDLTGWFEAPLQKFNNKNSSNLVNDLIELYEDYSGPGQSTDPQAIDDLDDSVDAPIKPKVPLSKQKSQAKIAKALSSKAISEKAAKVAELRTVLVLFMKIEGFDLDLFVDSTERNNNMKKQQQLLYEMNRFLDRTENEVAADLVLATKFQQCMQVIIDGISIYNGQLRQFIVDDKGTVAIATFGLRGSVGADNAASAIESSRAIIQGLADLQLSVSIGITTGKGYCGLVGSSNRHEFAVMGPSTNLSARLMSKTPPNSITCDAETKNADRMHSFEPLGEITAKGYSNPVMTYLPVIENSHGSEKFNFQSFMHQLSLTGKGHGHSSKANLLKKAKIEIISERRLFSTDTDDEEDYEFSGVAQLKEFVESHFYVPASEMIVARSSLRSPRQIKLFGRQKILYRMFSFLFPAETVTKGVDAFDMSATNRMVACCSASGLGKSALLKSIAAKFSYSAAKSPAAFPIAMIQNHTKGAAVAVTSQKIPFGSWKSIFLDMLKTMTSLPAVENKRSTASVRGNTRRSIALRPDYSDVLEHLFSQLPISVSPSVKTFILQTLGLSSLTSNFSTMVDAVNSHTNNNKSELRGIALTFFELIQVMFKKINKFIILFM